MTAGTNSGEANEMQQHVQTDAIKECAKRWQKRQKSHDVSVREATRLLQPLLAPHPTRADSNQSLA